ncbi:hypothetical protein [Marinobacterium jannaschii]|uniref:hypothetical protein n=1 Tax=Marinobacterium jannaschii TaxID=64970 RepID=UPI0004842E6A|nr:hypothetical protein [Marinobacterium jannaschii]
MGPTETGLLILLGIGLMAAIALFIQAQESRRRERSLLIMHLRTSIRRAEHLLDNTPAIFLTPEIRKLLLAYLESKVTQLIETNETSESKDKLSRIQELSALGPEPTPHPAGSMTVFRDQPEAQQARALLRELAKFIDDVQKKGELNSSIASKLTDEVKRNYQRVNHDLELMAAIEAEETRGAKVAAHYYRHCYSNLQKLNINQILDRQLFEIRRHINELSEKIAQDAENTDTDTPASK